MNLLQHVTQMLEHASDKYGKPLWKPTVRVVTRFVERTLPVLEADAFRLTQVGWPKFLVAYSVQLANWDLGIV